jgi:hypothetical protein
VARLIDKAAAQPAIRRQEQATDRGHHSGRSLGSAK